MPMPYERLFYATAVVAVSNSTVETPAEMSLEKEKLAEACQSCVSLDIDTENGSNKLGENVITGISIEWDTLRTRREEYTHLLVTDIRWETDGMLPVEDCALPMSILVINAPANYDEDYVSCVLSEEISEVYGFLHFGFDVKQVDFDRRDKRTTLKADTVMIAPER